MNKKKSGLALIVSAFRGAFLGVFAMSGVVNLLALTGSFYMLQIYDRVLTSHSVPTLVAFSILAGGLYVFQGVLDVLRSQVMIRLGIRLDRRVSPLAHDTLLRLPLYGTSAADATRPVRDVDTVRTFLGSQGPIAIFDLPWMPLYLAFVYFLHPWLGILATCGVILLVGIMILTEALSRDLNARATEAGMVRSNVADMNARNAEVLRAMGFGDRASDRFKAANESYVTLQAKAVDVTSGLGGVSRVLRMVLQSAVLGAGAYLTLEGVVTAGAIIAASIATSRALAPIEMAIGHWKGFVTARQAYARLQHALNVLPDVMTPIDLPAPTRQLKVEHLFVGVPGSQRLVLNDINLELSAGDGLGVIGPSASGKSTLVRAITGVWPIVKGAVRLDGAAIDQWPLAFFRNHVGYLPQDVALLDGTIEANIARFDPDADPRAVIRAAQAANVHELILRLPDGYETQLGPGGMSLSAGQRQRIALARALYGEPFLVVLDEPNANLDTDGDLALTGAIAGVRQRGGIVIVVAHRPSALQAVNLVALVNDGQLQRFGPRDEILREVLPRSPRSAG